MLDAVETDAVGDRGGARLRSGALRWSELDHRERRRHVLRTALALALVWIGLFASYYRVPLNALTDRGSLVLLALGIGFFAAVVVWQTGRISRAEVPVLRAIQALGASIPLFLVVFASLYLSLSLASASRFSEPLDHTGALYFTITVFSTVGFGDITPEGGLARMAVSAQMLLDLVVIGAVVRILVHVTRTALDR